MKTTTKIDTYIVALTLLAICVWLAPAFASGDRIEQNNEVTGGDTIVEGDRSDALGIGLGSNGAAAIDDCLYTVQAGFGAAQWVKPNKICLAEKLDQMGKHEAAAKVRCTIDAIQAIYPDKAGCQAEMLVLPKVPKSSAETPLAPLLYEQEQLLDHLSGVVAAQNERIETLSAEVEKAKKRPVRAPAAPQTIIQREPFLTDKKRAALAAIQGDL